MKEKGIRVTFYGPVQGMIRTNNFFPNGYSESLKLSKVIKEKGCGGCPRLNSKQVNTDCFGVNWIGLTDGILYQEQMRPVHIEGNNCQLLNMQIEVPDNLIKSI